MKTTANRSEGLDSDSKWHNLFVLKPQQGVDGNRPFVHPKPNATENSLVKIASNSNQKNTTGVYRYAAGWDLVQKQLRFSAQQALL